ncbi:stage V sporulation protein S [Halanaerobium sp. Z-7514]|uniref:Stage V sporulation protein S n=1 Tax=Halanaerobium polyolivorans TaxID=2886943 RepID=A0AAW4WWZ4_9FIRM|nr:stage V sporulation protein S [Halanaerobium polyolivorans]MCC3143792.1 stage V sporulation protein S [Halanaerobium polyolivorans]RQD75814.1 MAG: stage V sporulation protein S [Halanaerobium sp. MSAO_Bac5]
MDCLRVASKSDPKSVAGALSGLLRENKKVELQAIGAGAVNQTIKAIAISRGYVAPNGIDLILIPAFTEVEINGQERTAIKFLVEPR